MTQNIMTIRQKLDKQIGKKVKLIAYEARNQITEHTGVLSNTYPSVFIIDLANTPNSVDRVSYNYSDILTGYINLQFN